MPGFFDDGAWAVEHLFTGVRAQLLRSIAAGAPIPVVAAGCRRELLIIVASITLPGEDRLLGVRGAGQATGNLRGAHQCRQEARGEKANDCDCGNDDEEFDQGKSATACSRR